jgi:hypothetical protein
VDILATFCVKQGGRDVSREAERYEDWRGIEAASPRDEAASDRYERRVRAIDGAGVFKTRAGGGDRLAIA